jgi:hypothetical protein
MDLLTFSLGRITVQLNASTDLSKLLDMTVTHLQACFDGVVYWPYES